jgi:hypothetical protein
LFNEEGKDKQLFLFFDLIRPRIFTYLAIISQHLIEQKTPSVQTLKASKGRKEKEKKKKKRRLLTSMNSPATMLKLASG